MGQVPFSKFGQGQMRRVVISCLPWAGGLTIPRDGLLFKHKFLPTLEKTCSASCVLVAECQTL